MQPTVSQKKKSRNELIGATVTVSGWNAGHAPATPSNIVDGNGRDTNGGEGIITATGSGDTGACIIIDRGAGNTYPLLIHLDFDVKSTANSTRIYALHSNDNGVTDEYVPLNTQALLNSYAATSYKNPVTYPAVVNKRYIKISLYATGAGDFYLKPYELVGINIGG